MQLISKALVSSSAILFLTILHHYYGAIIYSTPWRTHVVFFAGPVLVLLGTAWFVSSSWPTRLVGRLSKWFFVIVAGVVSFGMFGLYEGGYNHVLKDLLYFGGASSQTMLTLFPAPTYEMPNDLVFEVTGVAQFFVAIWAGRDLFRLARQHRQTQDTTSELNGQSNLVGAVKGV